MSATELLSDGGYLIAWTPNDEIGRQHGRTAGVRVGPWPDRAFWSDPYELTLTPDFVGTDDEARYLRDIAFQIVLDGCPPADVLREFSRIPAWRRMRLTSGHWAFIPGQWREWNPHNDPATDRYWESHPSG